MSDLRAVSADSVIDALGGTTRLSEALGCNKSVVSSWRSRGIPSHRWSSLVRLAAEKGKEEITFESLAASAEANS